MLTWLRRMYEHMVWADERMLAALRDMGDPPANALVLIGHVLGSEHTWMSRVEGRAPELPIWPELTVAECAMVAASNHAAYRRLLDAADATALQRTVHYVNSKGEAFDSVVGDILLHV